MYRNIDTITRIHLVVTLFLSAMFATTSSSVLAHAGHGTPLENLSAEANQKKQMGGFFGGTLYYDDFPETRRGEMVLEVYTLEFVPVLDATVEGFIHPAGDRTTSTTLFFRRDRRSPQMHVVRPLIPGGVPHTMELTIDNFKHRETLLFDGIESGKVARVEAEREHPPAAVPPAAPSQSPAPRKKGFTPTQWLVLTGAAVAGGIAVAMMVGKRK